MPRIPRVVPWTNFDEFETVYQWLYSDPALQLELCEIGVKRVRAWAARGKVPHAVESTATFLELSIRDQQSTVSSVASQHDLRLAYSMAIVRFVNGLVDPAQKSFHAQSVAAIAERINLPPWFVELRHSATHEHLPGLSVLRNACSLALTWLRDNYWLVALNRAQSLLDEESIGDLSTLVKNYKELRKQFLRNRQDNQKIETGPNGDAEMAHQALRKLVKTIVPEMVRDGVIPILLEVGSLVPIGKKKRPTFPNLDLGEDLLQLWSPLLRKLDNSFRGFVEELVIAMLDRISIDTDEISIDKTLLEHTSDFLSQQTQKNSASQVSISYLVTLTAWLKHFIMQSYDSSVREKVRIFQEVPLDDIVETCLKRPGIYTRALLGIFSECDSDLSTDLAPFLRYIDGVLIARGNEKKVIDVPVLTDNVLAAEVEKLKLHVTEVKNKTKPSVNVEILDSIPAKTSWRLYDVETWQPTPLGYLPGGIVPRLELPLELDEEKLVDESSDQLMITD